MNKCMILAVTRSIIRPWLDFQQNLENTLHVKRYIIQELEMLAATLRTDQILFSRPQSGIHC